MKSTKTKQTAARLDRFKKADHWSQRRVEEGFAAYAECVANNYTLVEAQHLAADLPEPLNLTPYYTVVLVFVTVLVFYGFLAEWGFINYAPILK